MAGNLTFFDICSFAVGRSESGLAPGSVPGSVLLPVVRVAVVVDNQFQKSVADRFLYGSSSLSTGSRGICNGIPLTVYLFDLEGEEAILKIDWLYSRNGVNHL